MFPVLEVLYISLLGTEMETDERTCSKCGEIYPLTREFFGQTKTRGKIYFRRVCRSCVRANSARHHEEDPSKVMDRVANRKWQENEAEGHYSEYDITVIRNKLNDRCRYCDTPLNDGGDIEHETPISREGTNWPDNITLACYQCNKEKHGKTLEEYFTWRKERGLYCRDI